MSVAADQITIAITVYNRREYLHQAIRSALNQTVPVLRPLDSHPSCSSYVLL